MKRTRITLNKQTTIHINDMTEREKEILEAAFDDGIVTGAMLMLGGLFFIYLLALILT